MFVNWNCLPQGKFGLVRSIQVGFLPSASSALCIQQLPLHSVLIPERLATQVFSTEDVLSIHPVVDITVNLLLVSMCDLSTKGCLSAALSQAKQAVFATLTINVAKTQTSCGLSFRITRMCAMFNSSVYCGWLRGCRYSYACPFPLPPLLADPLSEFTLY